MGCRKNLREGAQFDLLLRVVAGCPTTEVDITRNFCGGDFRLAGEVQTLTGDYECVGVLIADEDHFPIGIDGRSKPPRVDC